MPRCGLSGPPGKSLVPGMHVALCRPHTDAISTSVIGKTRQAVLAAWKLNACARARWIRTGARETGHAMVSSMFAMRTAEAHQGRRLPPLPLCLFCITVAVLTSRCLSCCEHIGDAERNGVRSLAICPVNSGIRVAGPCIELLFRAPLFAYV